MFNLNLFNGSSAFAAFKLRTGAVSPADGNLTPPAGLSGTQPSLNAALLEAARPQDEVASGKAESGGPEEASSPNRGLDAGDLRIEVSSNTSSSAAPLAFEAKLSQDAAPGVAASSGDASTNAQPANELLSKPSGNFSPSPEGAPADPSDAGARAEVQLAAFAPGASSPTGAHSSATDGAPANPPAQASPVERMQPLIEAPAPPAGSHQSITVKVAGETAGAGIDLRFIERGGDIHLSVRTPSPEVAQELRGSLSDLANRFEHAGLRAEISSPSAADSSFSNSSFSGSPDSRGEEGAGGRGSGRNAQDTQDQQQDSRGSNRSRWVKTVQDFPTSNQEQHS